MNLYQVTNGAMGESYVRCYAWAMSEDVALSMAVDRFREAGMRHDPARLLVRLLFDGRMDAFCTHPSDTGFDDEEI